MTARRSSSGSGDFGGMVAAFSSAAHQADDSHLHTTELPHGKFSAEQITPEVLKAADQVTKNEMMNDLHLTPETQVTGYRGGPYRPGNIVISNTDQEGL